MYCRNCGKKLPDNTVFCPECGMRASDAGAGYNSEDWYGQEYGGEVQSAKTQGNSMLKIVIVVLVVLLIAVVAAGTAYISHTNREAELRILQEEKEIAQQKAEAAEAAKQKAEQAAEAAQNEAEEVQKNSSGSDKANTVNNYYYYRGSHYGENDYYNNVQVDGYLWPTDAYYITYSDLNGMNKDTVEAVRNEIYARHGYAFQKDRWKNYFGGKSWYVRDSSCTEDVAKARMNSTEKANLDTIIQYEEQMGWR